MARTSSAQSVRLTVPLVSQAELRDGAWCEAEGDFKAVAAVAGTDNWTSRAWRLGTVASIDGMA